ncbi:MAG: peptidoglycan-binding protein [Clostridia bacterium]|nr:peptidoglycan-binding protein [Clostridia bacterium]
MINNKMKRSIAAALCAVMMGASMPFGALAEGAGMVEIIAPQYSKIHASAEVNGTSITVHASGMSNPVIRAVLDGGESHNMNGSHYTFKNVAPGKHTVQVRYNAPDTGDYASNVVTVTVEAPQEKKAEKSKAAKMTAELLFADKELAVRKIEKIEKIEKIDKIEKIEPVGKIEEIDKIEKIEKIEPVGKVEEIDKIEKIEPVGKIEEIDKIEKIEEIDKTDKTEPPKKEKEPVYSKISAQVKTGKNSITVTIVEASSEAMYVAVGDDFKQGLHKGDSVTFSDLPAGKYDIEVDYENGTNVFRTSAVIEAEAADEGETVTPPAGGGAELVTPPDSGDEEKVKAFTILPVVTGGSIAVVVDGASSREVEVTLLDKDGKQVGFAAIIGSGLVQLGKFASGTYTVRAQYVTPVKGEDGSYDFKVVTAKAVVAEGVTAPEQSGPVDIEAKVETGKDYIVITVTEAMDREMIISIEGLSDRKVFKGNSVRYDDLTPGETYSIEIDYTDYVKGAKKFSAEVTLGDSGKHKKITISDVSAGENVLRIKGTAKPKEQILVQAEPEGAKPEALVVGEDGRFDAKLSANAGTYTKVSVYYVTNAASLVSKSGSWTVTEPADAPSVTVEPVNINSKSVVVRTGANLNVILKTPDTTVKGVTKENGAVKLSLPHTYLKGDVLTVTVMYGADGKKSVSKRITVEGIGNYNDLEYGDTGDDVLRLTTRLAELGYPVSPTSRYGSTVRKAVELFQEANGQKVDGEAGDTMQRALYSVHAIPYRAGKYPTLERGDKDASLIYKLQQRLKDLGYYTISVDGIFGSGTQRAVREFQRVNGLSVTGVADNATQTLLYSSAAKPAYSSGGAPSDYSTLSRSDKYKSAVVTLQKRLRALGYYSGNIDGYFGSQTYRAVRNFQNRNGLSVTGVADPYTQKVLYSSSAKTYSGSTASSGSVSSGYRLLYWGCRGDDVTRLQNALIKAGYKSLVRKADGIFGQWTYDAVRAFQKDHGLSVDGIAGKNTQNALYGAGY